MSVLSAQHLAKQYGGRPVVSDVSLTVQSGEVVGLLGPNGAGKTTSFYMIIGLIKADDGTVYLDNRDLSGLPMHVRARQGLGYLPQEPSIFRKLSVADNIMALLEIRSKMTQSQRRRRVDALLRELDLSHLHDRRGETLSGGERRRVEIARTLAMEPRFILLDEPFAGIDPISVIGIQRIVRFLSERSIGVLLTDHQVREALGICDRAFIVVDGQILKQGTPEEVLADQRVRDLYLGEDFQL
ncbi:MAG: LPS export ABC transporter ATP-binding protein [Gammaproteobacteria bacterium]|nr:LPS export ABC transporter ATP-binding protein [Gammaproteobacteria bacterium]